MHMVIIFYLISVVGVLLLSFIYMNKYWTDEKFEKLDQIEKGEFDD